MVGPGAVAATGAYSPVEGGVVAPLGFTAAGVHAGLKREGRPDVALVAAASPVSAAAVFTTNAIVAAPVVVSRQHVADGRAHAVVINAGNANACTGEGGIAAAHRMASATAEALGCSPMDVIVASTGVIGVELPVDLVASGIAEAASELDSRSGDHAAAAIMTTDTFAKQTALSFDLGGRTVTIGGMAKGSGMIKPNMATMLAVVTTDVPLTSGACDAALRSAVATTFNRVTVDSDTSTNDMAVLMASGEAGGALIDTDAPELEAFTEALRTVCLELARMIARDGEGATKLVAVQVTGAADEIDAEIAAFAVAESPLVKTAIFGKDANWGRVAMAVGKSGAALDASALEITFAGITVCQSGTAVPFDEDEALEALGADEVDIVVDLGVGNATATVYTCDLTYEYVRINGEYRS